MLLVKTKIKPSKIHGIGLFADQFIPKGMIVWRFTPGFDLEVSKKALLKLSKPSREQFFNYCYQDYKTRKYILNFDDARFFNHSEKPNTRDIRPIDSSLVGSEMIAIKDIKNGEEITYNYKEEDIDYNRKFGIRENFK